jgi:hypothetical protein
MPYSEQWVAPELLLEHNGVKVFLAYRDNCVEQGPAPFRFVTREDQDGDDAFDVRDLPTWKEPMAPPLARREDPPEAREAAELAWRAFLDVTEPAAIREALIAAIERGFLTPERVVGGAR